MKRAVRVAVLAAVMAVTAYGGDMQNGVTTVPTPPPPPPSSPQSAEVEIGAEFVGDVDVQNGVAETVVEVSLSLLQTLLALI